MTFAYAFHVIFAFELVRKQAEHVFHSQSYSGVTVRFEFRRADNRGFSDKTRHSYAFQHFAIRNLELNSVFNISKVEPFDAVAAAHSFMPVASKALSALVIVASDSTT